MFSPYVVVGHEPVKPEIIVEIPSPSNDLWRPGSLVKSFPTILLVTNKWPICSERTTKAAGARIMIALKSKEGVTKAGKLNHAFPAIAV